MRTPVFTAGGIVWVIQRSDESSVDYAARLERVRAAKTYDEAMAAQGRARPEAVRVVSVDPVVELEVVEESPAAEVEVSNTRVESSAPTEPAKSKAPLYVALGLTAAVAVGVGVYLRKRKR